MMALNPPSRKICMCYIFIWILIFHPLCKNGGKNKRFTYFYVFSHHFADLLSVSWVAPFPNHKRTKRHIIAIKAIKSIGYRRNHQQFYFTNPVFSEYASDILCAIRVSYYYTQDRYDPDICFCVKRIFFCQLCKRKKKKDKNLVVILKQLSFRRKF